MRTLYLFLISHALSPTLQPKTAFSTPKECRRRHQSQSSATVQVIGLPRMAAAACSSRRRSGIRHNWLKCGIIGIRCVLDCFNSTYSIQRLDIRLNQASALTGVSLIGQKVALFSISLQPHSRVSC